MFVLLAEITSAAAQQAPQAISTETPPTVEDAQTPQAPARVEVNPAARDDEIVVRLQEILKATGWFTSPQVGVDNGVVFLDGETADEQYKTWASELAHNTEGVVAVVNRVEVTTPALLDFSPARQEFEKVARSAVRALPLVLVAVVVLALAWIGAKFISQVLRRTLRPRMRSNLLREVASRAAGILVFLLGLYLVLRVSGLSRLAVTVIGGTGLVGLVLGIAFRDITENFLASLFLSLQQPFREGDLVEVAGTTGYIQRLTSRTTVIMTLDGNLVQVPNSTVFKSVIRNYTSNPNRREDFIVGIGYEDAIPHAQQVALRVLADHPAVLKDPEPWVLVDNLGTSTVNLRVYFWLDGCKHSWLKVRSSVIRLVKRALQDAGVSLPDEAREIIFPRGVPVQMLEPQKPPVDGRKTPPKIESASEAISTEAEAHLQTEAGKIKEQARNAWTPDQGENLLSQSAPNANPSGDV
jgi:small-conductance mechanosensitive channel